MIQGMWHGRLRPHVQSLSPVAIPQRRRPNDHAAVVQRGAETMREDSDAGRQSAAGKIIRISLKTDTSPTSSLLLSLMYQCYLRHQCLTVLP